jgi:hypothetical protein
MSTPRTAGAAATAVPLAGSEPMLLYLVKQVELAVRSHLDNLVDLTT